MTGAKRMMAVLAGAGLMAAVRQAMTLPPAQVEKRLMFPVQAESQPEGWAATQPGDAGDAGNANEGEEGGAECWEGLQWERYRLANGTQVLAVHVEGAARQALFDFQPIGLIDDKPAQAQFAHLLEHMLIRSTEKGRLNTWGLEINGETTAETMRLELFADESRWDEALEKQTMWLREGQLDWKNLDGEKQAIATEEQITTASGFTNKFAMAAWNQVVRQGMKEAHVHGDVEGGAIEPVLEMVHTRRAAGGQMMIGTIGPMDLKEVRESLEKMFGILHAVKTTRPAGVVKGEGMMKDFRAQWDMPTKHMMRWWKVGEVAQERIQNPEPRTQNDEEGVTTQIDTGAANRPAETMREDVQEREEVRAETRLRAAAMCAGRAVQMKLMMSPAKNDGRIRNVLVTGGLETSDGELLVMVDCCVRDDAEEAGVWREVDEAVRGVAGEGEEAGNGGGKKAEGGVGAPQGVLSDEEASLGDQGREKEWVEQGDAGQPSSRPHEDSLQERGGRMMRMCAGMYAIEMGSVPNFEDAKAKIGNARARDFFEGNWLLGRCYIEFEWGVPFEEALEAIQGLDAGMIKQVQERLRGGGGRLVLEKKE